MVLLSAALLAGSCSKAPPMPLPKPGGLWTVSSSISPSFVKPTPAMDRMTELTFWTGFALFRDPWVAAPASTTARDGLGPVFSARSCVACHASGGRGDSLRFKPRAVGTVYRLVDEPTLRARFGTHLQPRATYDMNADGRRVSGFYSGEPYPNIEIRSLDTIAGSLRQIHAGLGDAPMYSVSPRLAPGIVGLGLLEAIPESRLVALADPEDNDFDGISGRINWIGDGDQRLAGRFGWKAPHPSVADQTADAFRNDIGITSALAPEEPCSSAQTLCSAQRRGDGPVGEHEINEQLFDYVVQFTSSLGVPDARPVNPEIDRGRMLFNDARCASCHTPSHKVTINKQQQEIWPYTDLLLHDMGPLLADGVVEGSATGGEWRTPPLWALGAAKQLNPETGFLHDGRASTIHEAVLWHGGEAAPAAAKFNKFSKADQDALVAFVLAL
ncbi:MAG: di-heme oxidoredictase family protein [Pseudomonadota bacterium]